MSQHDETCLLKKAFCCLMNSSIGWGLSGIVLGILLMVALGKADAEKAIWLTLGIAFTSMANAYQSYQSSKRAKEEREALESQREGDRRHQDALAQRDYAISTKLVAYENFMRSLTLVAKEEFPAERFYELISAFNRVELVGSLRIATRCSRFVSIAGDIQQLRKDSSAESDQKIHELVKEFAILHVQITGEMRDDIHEQVAPS